MTNTNRLSIQRFAYVALMGVLFASGSVLIAHLSKLLVDEFFCIIAIDICFFLAFVSMLTKKRINRELPQKNFQGYGIELAVVLLGWIVLSLMTVFAPDFFAPVMILAALFNTAFDDTLSMVLSAYFVIILCICQGANNYIVYSYILLVILGTIFSSFIKGKDTLERLFSLVLIFSCNILVNIIFYYFSFLELDTSTFVYAILSAFFTCVVFGLIVPFLDYKREQKDVEIFDELLDEDYSLVGDIRKYSFYEYKHALRVSHFSRICAQEIGARDELAACAGFYYRLGKMEGEPEIDNAIRVANDHCFPESIINILAEYGGILSLPSTRESAIVHMVDAVVTKIELLDNDTMSSSWNQNMVIYQTINELSQKGLYEESGLSMNQFLKIREKLANEDILA